MSNFANSSGAQASQNPHGAWKHVVFSLLIGILYVLISFPRLVSQIITTFVPEGFVREFLINAVATIQNAIIQVVPPTGSVFAGLISVLTLMLIAYGIVSLLYSLRYFDLTIPFLTFGGGIAGIMFLHIVAYIAIIASAITGFVFTLLDTFFTQMGFWFIIIAILTIVISFALLADKRVKGFILFLLSIIGLLYVITLIRPFVENLIRPIVEFVVIAYYDYLHPFFGPIGDIIANVLQAIGGIFEPIVAFILGIISALLVLVLTVLLTLVGVIVVFALIGHFLIDQLKSAWHIGESRKNILLGAFGIGTAIAILLLACIGNEPIARTIDKGIANAVFSVVSSIEIPVSFVSPINSMTNLFADTLPNDVKEFVVNYLRSGTAPMIDTSILLCVSILASIGIVRRLLRRPANATARITFYPVEIVMIFSGLAVAVGLAALQSATESDGN